MELTLKTFLLDILITLLRISRAGDFTGDLARNEFILKINDIFSNTEISLTICYGKMIRIRIV